MNKPITAVERAAQQLATLDMAGYGIVVLRCNQDADIRRVIELYSFGSKSFPSKYLCADSPNTYNAPYFQNIFEMTPYGTVCNFLQPFHWKTHGPDSELTLINVLTSCITGNSTLEHRLIYIPSFKLLGEESSDVRQYRRLLQEISRLKRKCLTNALVVVGCTDEQMCDELAQDCYILDIPYPEKDEVIFLIQDTFRQCDGGRDRLSSAKVSALAEIMRGLREDNIRRIIHMSFAKTQDPTAGKASGLFSAAKEEKQQMVKAIKGLTWKESTGAVGGLETLKNWLEKKRWQFLYPSFAALQKTKPPKGVFLCGLPGSGKSSFSMLSAQLLGQPDAPLPLVELSIQGLKGSLVGESEANCRMALRAIESIAPAVVILEEVDKVFGNTVGSSNDVTPHIFSEILNWMQKPKDKPIFVITTANKTDLLPPEFMRKGRFDEIFFFGLPTADECEMIFRIHLMNKSSVVAATDGDWIHNAVQVVLKEAASLKRFLSGADIETIVDTAFGDLLADYMTSLRETDLENIDGFEKQQVYPYEHVEQALINALHNTRSYFDNNMRTTVEFWVDMYKKQYLNAGTTENTILPAQKDAFDVKTGKFHWENLTGDYVNTLKTRLKDAVKAQDYNLSFRWELALEIYRYYNKA